MRLIAALAFVMFSFTAEAQFLKKTFKFAAFWLVLSAETTPCLMMFTL